MAPSSVPGAFCAKLVLLCLFQCHPFAGLSHIYPLHGLVLASRCRYLVNFILIYIYFWWYWDLNQGLMLTRHCATLSIPPARCQYLVGTGYLSLVSSRH
jgi:hypothetical protein